MDLLISSSLWHPNRLQTKAAIKNGAVPYNEVIEWIISVGPYLSLGALVHSHRLNWTHEDIAPMIVVMQMLQTNKMKLGAETGETVLDSKAVISAEDRSRGVTGVVT